MEKSVGGWRIVLVLLPMILFISLGALYRVHAMKDDHVEHIVPTLDTSEFVDITILHTTDVHGWLSGHPHDPQLDTDFGDFLSLVQHIEEKHQNNEHKSYLLLLDSGDFIEGTGLSDATPVHGEKIWPLVKHIPYTALTVGNHELGVASSIDELRINFVPHWNGRYLTANTKMEETEDYLGDPFYVHDTEDGGLRVLIFGYLFDFTHFADVVRVVTVADSLTEKYFEDAMAIKGVDAYIVLGHIDIEMTETEQIRTAIREHYPETPILFMSGHRHIKQYKQLDDNSVAIESGRYFQVLGNLTARIRVGGPDQSDYNERFAPPGNRLVSVQHNWVPTNLQNFYAVSGRGEEDFLTQEGAVLKERIREANEELGLTDVVGCLSTTYEPGLPLSLHNSLYRLVLTEMYPLVVYDTSRSNKQLAILNTSSLRSPLYAGSVDRNDIFSVDPFNNAYGSINALAGSLILELIDYLNDQPREKVHPYYSCAFGRDPNNGDGSEILPHFVYSPIVDIEADDIYDVVCTAYDCVTFSRALNDLTGVDYEHPDYTTEYSSTSALTAFLESQYPCDA